MVSNPIGLTYVLNRFAYVGSMAVDSSARRRGIGEQLLVELERLIMTEGELEPKVWIPAKYRFSFPTLLGTRAVIFDKTLPLLALGTDKRHSESFTYIFVIVKNPPSGKL